MRALLKLERMALGVYDKFSMSHYHFGAGNLNVGLLPVVTILGVFE